MVSTRASPAVCAELTAPRAAIRPFPCWCIQVVYCWPQLTGVRATEVAPWLAGAAAGAAVLLHAVSPTTAAPTVARAMRFNSNLRSWRSTPSWRIHRVDPVVGGVEGVRREGIPRPVGIHPAAGQGGQRPVRHRRGQPIRRERVMPGTGEVGSHIGSARRDRYRAGEVQL